MLKLPQGEFRAYLFDCDGTLADSMPLHFRAWQTTLEPWGCPFPEEQFYAWGGVPTAQIFQRLNVQHQLRMPVEELVHVREAHFMALLPELKPVAEVLAHFEAVEGKLPIGVVSGGSRATVIDTLERIGLAGRYQTLVAAEDCRQGKPHPEPFLTAAQRLGVAPEHCLAFEDAELGIQSAEAAGMRWVRVPLRG